METKTCRKCGFPKPLHAFVEVRPGCRRSTCIQCRKKRDIEQNPTRVFKERKRKSLKDKHQRHNGINISKWILEDSRRSDKKKGFNNDLSREFIDSEIMKGCQYCGETTLRMTLDRKDNTVGHIKENVIPCCIRCNYIRRDIPYEAWLLMVDNIRMVRLSGTFGSWTGAWRSSTSKVTKL